MLPTMGKCDMTEEELFKGLADAADPWVRPCKDWCETETSDIHSCRYDRGHEGPCKCVRCGRSPEDHSSICMSYGGGIVHSKIATEGK